MLSYKYCEWTVC